MSGTKARRTIVQLTVLAIVAALAVLGLQRAHASTAGGFEIDGNLVSNGDLDWSNVGGQPIGVDGVGADTSVFGGGSKENNPSGWKVKAGNVPGKDDIGNVYGYAHRSSGHEWAVFGFERASSNGTTLFTVELNQNKNKTNGNGVSVPDRSDGDLRLNVTQHGNGAFTVSGTVDRYTNDSWQNVSLAPGLVVGAANSGAIPAINAQDAIADAAHNVAAGHFAEVAFDLTAIDNLSSRVCRNGAFNVINARSQTSTSANSALKDYIKPLNINIPPECASLHISKTGPDGNTPAPGATFSISPNPKSGSDESSATVTDGAKAGNGNDIDDPDGKADGVINLQAEPGHDYTVTEVTPPAGYFLGATTKITHSADAQQTVLFSFSDPLGSVTFGKTDGKALLCCATFHVVGTSGPAKTAGTDVTVTDNGSHDAAPLAGLIKVNNLPKGDYSLTETVSPAGYAKDSSTKTFTIGPDQQHKDVTLQAPFVDQRIAAPTGQMQLFKAVSPKGAAAYGDTLTYALVAKAAGSIDEHNVVVSDVVPDNTTYVNGSAKCIGTPCTPSYDAASHTVHWALGTMAHGSARVVSFKVTINKPANATSLPAETITNVGSVATTEDPSTPSNEVKTPVTAVLGLHETVKPPATLPVTGHSTGLMALVGLELLGLGVIFTVGGRLISNNAIANSKDGM